MGFGIVQLAKLSGPDFRILLVKLIKFRGLTLPAGKKFLFMYMEIEFSGPYYNKYLAIHSLHNRSGERLRVFLNQFVLKLRKQLIFFAGFS